MTHMSVLQVVPNGGRALDEVDTAIIEFIRACLAVRQYPPSIREIGEELGFSSTSSTHHRLRKLERAGWIRRDPERARAITLADDERPAA